MPFNRAWGNHIDNGAINDAIASWQSKQPERVQTNATPSSLTDCPMVIWLKKQGVEPTNTPGWGQKQRFMLGRITENTIASQLRDEGILLHHWKDDAEGESIRFTMGEGLSRLTGTPDLLLKLPRGVAISDSKTSRSDSFNYVPIEPDQIWQDPYWYRYKLQVTAYFMLLEANKSWLLQHGLQMPTLCHLFSYALDNGIVHRELTWEPTAEDRAVIERLTERWNQAYVSADMPACTCVEDGTVLFCPFGILENGKKFATQCCDINLKEKVM